MIAKQKQQTNAILAMLSFVFITILLCAVCVGAVFLADFLKKGSIETDAGSVSTEFCIVIDAGHGGMDSGTSGVNGAHEKDLNLSVAKKLYELFRLAGIDCVLTRSEDIMLVDDSVKSHRKMQDLKTRVQIAESTENALFVSIHMNNFSVSRYSGLQVWYSKNDERSRSVASYIQTYAKTYLDPLNERETKKANSAIYVLDRIKAPAVLIECGFLSNPDECAKLCTDEYQTLLAVTIFTGLLGYMGAG